MNKNEQNIINKHKKNIYKIASKHLNCKKYKEGEYFECIAIPKQQKFFDFVIIEIIKYININNLLFLSRQIKDKDGIYVIYGIKLN